MFLVDTKALHWPIATAPVSYLPANDAPCNVVKRSLPQDQSPMANDNGSMPCSWRDVGAHTSSTHPADQRLGGNSYAVVSKPR